MLVEYRIHAMLEWFGVADSRILPEKEGLSVPLVDQVHRWFTSTRPNSPQLSKRFLDTTDIVQKETCVWPDTEDSVRP